jgi:hypothetical protein
MTMGALISRSTLIADEHGPNGARPRAQGILWYFFAERGGAEPWCWCCLNPSTGGLMRSSRCFSALWECAEDAKQHGYVRVAAQMATSFAASLSRGSPPQQE